MAAGLAGAHGVPGCGSHACGCMVAMVDMVASALLEQEIISSQQVREEFLLRRRLKLGDEVLEEGTQQMY